MAEATVLTSYGHPALGIRELRENTTGLYRYARTSFYQAGLNSYAKPPAENEDQFQLLTNVRPPLGGMLQRRWGYTLLQTGAFSDPIDLMFAYENEVSDTRKLVLCGPDSVIPINEDGSFYCDSLFTPAEGVPRMCNSRDYAFFADGKDLLKWNGKIPEPVSAVAFVQSISSNSSLTVTLPAVGTVGNYIFVGLRISCASSSQTISVSDNLNNVWQLASSIPPTTDGTNYEYCQIFVSPSILAGTQTITATFSGTVVTSNMAAAEFSGVGSPITDGPGATATGTSGAIASGSFSTTAGDLVLGFASSVGGGGCNVGTGFTPLDVEGVSCFEYQIATSTTSNAVFYSPSPGNWTAQGIAFLAAQPAVTKWGIAAPETPVTVQIDTTEVPTYVQTAQSTTNVLTITGTTAGNTLILCVVYSATQLSGPTILLSDTQDNQWFIAQSGSIPYVVPNNVPYCQIAYVNNIEGGDVTITATLENGTAVDAFLIVAEFSGIGPPDNGGVAYEKAGALSPNIPPVPTAANDLVISMLTIDEAATVASGWTQVGTTGTSIPDYDVYMTYQLATSTSSTLPSFTGSPGKYLYLGVPFKPGGSITLNFGRKYYSVFKNADTDNFSDVSPVSVSTGSLLFQSVNLSNLPVSIDPQVTDIVLLATGDGGDETLLYFLADLPNGTLTYLDNTANPQLVASNIYYQIDAYGINHGVVGNQPPPAGMVLPIKHQGRIFGVQGGVVYFSKNLDECTTSTGTIAGRYEEDFPPTYEFDISEGAETIRGLISDGTTLWIGTQRNIKRLDGNGPLNFLFKSLPESGFNEAGILNQDVWKLVYNQDQPVGSIYLTPDYRVIFTNFSGSQDIGTPIQDTLNSINTAVAANVAQAMFAVWAEFNLYILAVPTGSNTTCDTLLVYDIRLKQWFLWNLTDNPQCMLYNINNAGIPQWLFATTGSTPAIYNINPAATQDRVGNTPVNFLATVRTPWLSFGDPTLRKVLNAIEVITPDIRGMTITVEGSSVDQFDIHDQPAPNPVVTEAQLIQSPFGPFKVYLAARPSKDRFYRLTFYSRYSADGNNGILHAYDVEILPWNRL